MAKRTNLKALVVISIFFLASSAKAQTIWTGAPITFTKTNYADWTNAANQDRITDNVWLTRKDTEGLFNIAQEAGFDSSSPADTEWAYGSAVDWQSLTFQPWVDWHDWTPPDMVGQDAVLHLITDDIYIDIKFLSWTEGGAGGGFSYERSTRSSYCYYVDANSPPGGNGLTWETAFNYLQDALDVAEDGNDIWVADGTYNPDANSTDTDGSGLREATFQLKNGVRLYGGYVGYGAPDPSARDIQLYETILSGDLDGNDTQGLDPCDLPNDPNRGENSYHVVTGSGTDATAILDGFTITTGNANGVQFLIDDVGGGIYNVAGNPTVTNCMFSGNQAHEGGGMYNMGGSSNVTNCTFSGNTAHYQGGGMQNLSSSANVTNCTFSGNSADYGGGMSNIASSPTVTNCLFSGNSATDGSGIYNYAFSDATVINCTFSGNVASNMGGGIYSYHTCTVTVTNSILWGNTAGTDGAEIAVTSTSYPSTMTISYSDVQGGQAGAHVESGCTLNWDAGSNINADPCFVDANGPDDIIGTEDDNLRLMPDSPCIDAGNNTVVTVTTDLDGNPRISDCDFDGTATVNMGAYEREPMTLYVDADAPGANNGSSWDDAFNYLQDALVAAIDGDEIWVADGTYNPDANSTYTNGSGEREATFGLINGVGIYGGYAGYGATDPNARNVELYETILSGDLDGNDTPGLDPCDLLNDPNRGENSYHVVTGSGTNANTVLDGFTITAGNANGGGSDDYGAGMYNYQGSPTVTNCTFTGNSASLYGGGMENYTSSSPIVANCTFIGNSAGEDSGGLENWTGCNATVTNCTFSGNVTYYGGGMGNYGSSPTVTNCTFSGNSANDGGGMYHYGGSLTVTNCILWGNTAASDGNEIALADSSTIDVNCCDIKDGNDGIYNDGSCTINWGNANIDADPCFVDANGPDGIIGTEDDNLRLMPDSPCIDVGDNAAVPADTEDFDNDGNTVEPIPYDLDGRDRFADGDCNDTYIVDMGAYEFAWVYIGDFAGGCDVDFVDFSVLGLTWLLEEQEAGYDPNCDISLPADGVIDEKDLKIFTDNWLAGM